MKRVSLVFFGVFSALMYSGCAQNIPAPIEAPKVQTEQKKEVIQSFSKRLGFSSREITRRDDKKLFEMGYDFFK